MSNAALYAGIAVKILAATRHLAALGFDLATLAKKGKISDEESSAIDAEIKTTDDFFVRYREEHGET